MNTSKKKRLPLEDDADEIMSSDSDEEKFVWAPKSIDIMLMEYKNNMDKLLKPGVPRRRIWDVVRKKLVQEGFQGVRSDMCLKKFGKLKLLYKEFASGHKVHRSFANHAKILKEILDKAPPDVKSEDEEKNFAEEMKDCPSWFACFIERYLKDEEERRHLLKKFHDDIVTVETKKCQLLEMLVQKTNASPLSPPVIHVQTLSSDLTPAQNVLNSSSQPKNKPTSAAPIASNGEVGIKTEVTAVKRKLSPDVKLHKVMRKTPAASNSDHNYNNSTPRQQTPPQSATPKPQQASLKGLSALFKNKFNHNLQLIPVNEGDPGSEAITVHDGVITIQNNEGTQIEVTGEAVSNLPSEIIILNAQEEPDPNAMPTKKEPYLPTTTDS